MIFQKSFLYDDLILSNQYWKRLVIVLIVLEPVFSELNDEYKVKNIYLKKAFIQNRFFYHNTSLY